MLTTRMLALSVASVVISSTSLVSDPDLSRYRQFQFGSSLATVTRLAGITAEARVLYQRPELIQEVMWLPPPTASSTAPGESVRKVLFSFYDDQLFKIVVTYDREKTEGLTVKDLVDAISTEYGPPTLAATEAVPAMSTASVSSDKIVAHWEDSQYSINLFRSSYLSTFGLVALSTRLDGLVRIATAEAVLLDEQQAPQREIERQQKQTAEDRVKQATARRMNKAAFRP